MLNTSNNSTKVYNLILRFNRIVYRLYRTSLALIKPALIFSTIIDCLKASLKAKKKDSLLIKLTQLRTKAEISLLYLRFNSIK